MIKVSAYVKKIPREKENDTAVNIFFFVMDGLVYLQDNFNDGLFQGQVSPQDFSLGLLKLLKTTGKLTFSQSFFLGLFFLLRYIQRLTVCRASRGASWQLAIDMERGSKLKHQKSSFH